MTEATQPRRALLIAGAATVGGALTTGASGLLTPVRAQGLVPTPTMRGGANNYLPGAPVVTRIGGGGGFWLTGTVPPRRRRRAAPAHPHPDLGAYHGGARARPP